MDLEVIKRFLKNNCSKGEIEKIKDWLNDSSNNENISLQLSAVWKSICEEEKEENYNLEDLLNQIHHQINISEFENRQIGSKNFNFSDRFYKTFSKIAAILILPLMAVNILYFVFYSRPSEPIQNKKVLYSEIRSSQGVKTAIDLPDGTKVWLNGGSILRFPQVFSGKTRDIELIGEAYFEVEKDENHPFIVKTSNADVKALGTKFNVRAYPEEKIVEAALLSGKICMVYDHTFLGEKEKIIQPGHVIILNKENKNISVKQVNTQIYTSWLDDKLILRDTPLDESVRLLSRWFNVQIMINDTALSKYYITATFKDETLKQVLELLKIAAPIDYSYKERLRQSDNSFSKIEVRITKKNIR
jgi:transmembrane sensor